MKICNKCKTEMEPHCFFNNKSTKDGKDRTCKKCSMARSRKWIEANREKSREHFRKGNTKRRSNPEHAKANRDYLKTPKGLLISRKNGLNQYYKNKDKALARTSVRQALKNNLMTKHPCEKCGSIIKIHAHHDDYSKPLEVRWLCHKHHMEHHRLEREQQRQQQQ